MLIHDQYKLYILYSVFKRQGSASLADGLKGKGDSGHKNTL